MANAEQFKLLKAGVKVWNRWRNKQPNQKICLEEIDLSKANLMGVNLRGVDLRRAELSGADLREADLSEALLRETNLSNANLRTAYLGRANLRGAKLDGANLYGADLCGAHLDLANLSGAILNGADISLSTLRKADLSGAELRGTNLRGADLEGAILSEADIRGANLERAILSRADLSYAKLREIHLSETNINDANFYRADLSVADLSRAKLEGAILTGANLSGANLSYASLYYVGLSGADLSGADLSYVDFLGVDLSRTGLIGADITGAKISKSDVHGVNVWDLKGEFEEQKDLVITPPGESSVTVDNIKVAQFIYLILNNKEIRDAINTLTSKTVLILGRFALPERKEILDALRDKLREYDLLPIVFDFDRPTDKDFTETIKTLAGLSYFVIADVTNPKSSPLELQATIPDYQIPFVPIIQEGEYPFAMMVDLQKKYNWVLDTISYDSLDTLIEILKPYIIDPAIKKHDELRISKAKQPTIISGRELRNKGTS